MDNFTIYAQKKLGDTWFPYKFERVFGGVILTGAECPLKKDGTPNFRKKNIDTISKLIYPIEE